MSFFDISNLANKFAGFDIPPDIEFQQRSDDYGYSQTGEYGNGYDGQPPSGYQSGPQEGEEVYRSTHPDFSTSDTTRNGLGGGNGYAYNPSSQELDEKAENFKVEAPLPEGWTKRFDEGHNRWFYVNKETGESQWDPPKREVSGDGDGEGQDQVDATTHEHDPNKPWYDQNNKHADGGEASGYYTGTHYQANRPYEDGAYQQAADEGGGYPQGGGEGQRSVGGGYGGYPDGGYGGERSYGGGGYPSEGEGRSSSGYGKVLLGAAGGLAVGAAGGALLAHAMASDSEDEGAQIADGDEQAARSAYAGYGEEVQDPEPDSSLADSSDEEPEPEVEPEPSSSEDEEPEVEERALPDDGEEEEEEAEESEAAPSESSSESDESSEVPEEDEAEDEPEPDYASGDDGGDGEDSYDDDDYNY